MYTEDEHKERMRSRIATHLQKGLTQSEAKASEPSKRKLRSQIIGQDGDWETERGTEKENEVMS